MRADHPVPGRAFRRSDRSRAAGPEPRTHRSRSSPARRSRKPPGHGDLGRTLHVAGQIGHRHATLATLLVTTASTTSAFNSTIRPWLAPGLRDAPKRRHRTPARPPHLGPGRRAHAARRHPHRRHEIGAELHDRRVGRIHEEAGTDKIGLGARTTPGPAPEAASGCQAHSSSFSSSRNAWHRHQARRTPPPAAPAARRPRPRAVGRPQPAARRALPESRVVRSVMLPPASAMTPASRATIPSRSAPCTVTR